MLIGYARASVEDPSLTVQREALTHGGCLTIHEDQTCGAKAERPGLIALLAALREGDSLVVWRLDRLGRTLKDLIALVEKLGSRRIGFVSLTENIDTTTRDGKQVLRLFAGLAEFERNRMRERSQSALSAARARGRLGGRPKALDPATRQIAIQLYRERQHSIDDICKMMRISKPTLYSYLAEADANALHAA